MKPVITGVLVVVGGVVLSIAGLLLVRRQWPGLALSDSNEIGDDFITVLGTAYGVLVAFVVSSVWGRFMDAERDADEEANQIFTLLHILGLIQSPAGRQLFWRLMDYTHSLIGDEWGKLAEGRGSEKTQGAMEQLWSTFGDLAKEQGQSEIIVGEAMRRLEGLTDRRRIRLFNSDDSVPQVLWVLLVAEGVITVSFTYLLVAPNLMIQSLMTAALAGTISLSLYLIAALNHPFAGIPRVTESNLRTVMSTWEQVLRARSQDESTTQVAPAVD
jgi:uncharacterized membrane protein